MPLASVACCPRWLPLDPLDSGANSVAVSVQNEPNFSQSGTPSCARDPDWLDDFVDGDFARRLVTAGLGSIALAAPELAYVGKGAG